MRDCRRQNRGRSSRLRQHRFGRQRLQTRLNRRADLENCAIARIDNAAGFIDGVASYARDWEQGSCGGVTKSYRQQFRCWVQATTQRAWISFRR